MNRYRINTGLLILFISCAAFWGLVLWVAFR